jgi:uncharacterized protein HemX
MNYLLALLAAVFGGYFFLKKRSINQTLENNSNVKNQVDNLEKDINGFKDLLVKEEETQKQAKEELDKDSKEELSREEILNRLNNGGNSSDSKTDK